MEESSQISLKLFELKSGFMLSPVYQPDCSSDPGSFGGVYVLYCRLELDGKCLSHEHNVTERTGEKKRENLARVCNDKPLNSILLYAIAR